MTLPLGVQQGLVYELLGPDGTRAVINNPADPDYIGFLDEPPTGLERAGVRENAEALTGNDGGSHGAFLRDRLAWTLKGLIPPEGAPGGTWVTRQDRLLRATNALRVDGELRWTPPEVGEVVRVRFREQQPTRITGKRPKAFMVAGVCEEATVETLLERVANIAPTVASSSGFSSPLKSPLVSLSNAPAGVTIDAVGRAIAWPVLVVNGPCTNPILTNATTGQSIVLTYGLEAGERLVLNTHPRRRSILLNGDAGASRYAALQWGPSSWWGLAPGLNDVRLSLATYSVGASLEIHYRDTWG